MRTRAPLATPRPATVLWSDEDDATFNRTRDAVSDALESLDLPADRGDETVKIIRRPDSF